jgi:hypothetical protein
LASALLLKKPRVPLLALIVNPKVSFALLKL